MELGVLQPALPRKGSRTFRAYVGHFQCHLVSFAVLKEGRMLEMLLFKTPLNQSGRPQRGHLSRGGPAVP